MHRQLPVARPPLVLLLLRADPRARRTSSSPAGGTSAGPTRRSSSSSTRSSAPPSCSSGSWRSPSSTRRRPAYLTFSLGPLMQTHLSATTGSAALLGLHRRLRREGAAVPVPHLVARRLHRGARGGLGRPGRRPGQARHLRDHPLRPEPVPPGHPHPRPAAADAGGHRHRLRRDRGLRRSAT